MRCSLCGQRKAKRACPALRQDICPVCCATKRLVEIRCPADCPHLASARRHPPAAVKRQNETDLQTLTAGLGPLSEGQLQLFFLIHSHLLKPAADGVEQPVDAEVADAASALAATLETASRGVIFEHRAETVTGRRLAAELAAVLQEAGRGGGSRFEREAAVVFRAIATAASATATTPKSRAYLQLVGRVLREGAPEPAPVGPTIILP
jgi:hypothetical protein